MKFVKTVDEYEEYEKIQESLGKDLFDIPGVHKVSAHLKGDDIEIQLSNNQLILVPLDDLKDVAGDELNLDPRFLNVLSKFYSMAVLARYGAGLAEKIKALKMAEGYQLFDVSKGGFFDSLDKYLLKVGVCKEEATKIISLLPALYDGGAMDGITPENVANFTKYLDMSLEYVAAKIYVYLEFIGQDDIIIKRVPLGNIDKVTESEAVPTGEYNTEMEQGSYATFADYQKGLDTITRVANRAAELVGLSALPACDTATGRRANAASASVSIPLNDSDLKIVSILSPVEQKKVYGQDSFFVFSVEAEGELLDDEFSNLSNEKDIVKALKKLM